MHVAERASFHPPFPHSGTFDPVSRRWLMVVARYIRQPSPQSLVLLAASATADPTGAWNVYQIDGSFRGVLQQCNALRRVGSFVHAPTTYMP